MHRPGMTKMSDGDLVPVVGGPKDGEEYRWTSAARKLLIPDSKDIKMIKTSDGRIVRIFGEHVYEMKCYAMDGEESYRWEYAGYEPPNP